MVKHDSETPDPQGGERAGEAGESVAGRSARANVKRTSAYRTSTRSTGHVRAGAKALSREAQKILRKHRPRIDDAVAAEIEATIAEIERIRAQRPNEDIATLEYQAEHLDELLHHHASFARKSALRDTLENIGIAVLVALTVRSCVYEPFKIPSGSMMPTLRAGDHIFVNKFAYGVQIPLTTRVVGEDMISSIERGDVIVFRYPLDETDDFIKRVIGLPGDTVRVNSDRRVIEIKRAGSDRFEAVEREALSDVACQAENSDQPIENCTVYRETLDDHTYEVRYRDDLRNTDPSKRIYEVPEGHLLVMGDNRNASHDSLAWTVIADTVSAAGVVTRADIRDVTIRKKERIELHDEGDVVRANDGANTDRARYLAERDAPDRDFVLEVWRTPPIDADATFESLAHHHGATESTTLADVLANGAEKQAEIPDIGEVRYGSTEHGAELLFRAPAPHHDVVFRIHCGSKRCLRKFDLGSRAAWVLEEFAANPEYAARELLIREPGRADTFPGRGKQVERYLERRFGAEGEGIHIRAWREPVERLPVLRDAVLAEFGAGPLAAKMHELHGHVRREAAAVTDLGEDAWVIAVDDDQWAVIHADAKFNILTVLECGPRRCKSQTDAVELATEVASRFPIVAKEAERLPELFGQADARGLAEIPINTPPLYYWDHLTFDGAVLDDSHAIHVEIEWKPEDGLEAALERRKQALGAVEAVDGLGPAAGYAFTPNGHVFVFVIPQTELVVEVACRVGMCPDRETAQALAERAMDKGADVDNFVQKGVSRPRPFVPRGNVKGRAEVIWWPTSRFWKKID
jgi:signal peptidase I